MKHNLLSRAVRSTRRGMSLIEIVVVLAILGILATVIGGSMLGALDSANQDTTRIAIGRVSSALDMYAAKHRGKYPSTSQGLVAAKSLMPNGEVLLDAWGNDFVYLSPAQGCDAKYEIKSLGKDAKEGGVEFDTDISSCNLNGEE